VEKPRCTQPGCGVELQDDGRCPRTSVCELCGGTVHVGEFAQCGGDPRKHESVLSQQFHRPFKGYYSIPLGVRINSYAEAKAEEKRQVVFERRRPNRNFTEV
jgi:hypothetical protein